ncbi:beta-ketoacyl synthase N-terminal-like domain-containing protein, partial [Microbispora rosea]
MNTSVIVTGFGVTAPNGLGTRDYWSATLAGRSGIDRVSRFDAGRYPSRLAGAVTATSLFMTDFYDLALA